ncbi:hypothetical protein FGO68_gene17541 [Halteria grandinella]|uniref:Uncharacterized protein n=1 Tax=Halteria grandinella TaxID=5974 RepID=A0A8J8P4S9_HALGN|nr:hypothetical protein FGO68_gene17541 [Halteria grandinella]
MCVPDCGQDQFYTNIHRMTDGRYTNNPVNMTCEFLGQYCQYGNYTHGCIRSLKQGQATSLVHPSLADEDFILRQYYQDKPSHYKVSQITLSSSFKFISDIQLTPIENCLYLENYLVSYQLRNENSCALCLPGYFAQNITTTQDGTQRGECVTKCRDGLFPRVYLKGENPSYWYMYLSPLDTARCEYCHESCLTCISDGENGCTSCKKGYEFRLIDREIKTGSCIQMRVIIANMNEVTLYVSGDRQKTIYQANEFPDLLSALKQAYSLHLTYFDLKNVIVTLNENTQHYILQSDYIISYPLIDDSSFQISNYSITIMQAAQIN